MTAPTPGLRTARPKAWVWGIARLAVRTFYRVERLGRPMPDGALLLVANHPNTLLDPAVVQATAGRAVRLLAKSTLFRGHPMSLLVRHSGAIPIYRRSDSGVDTSRNTEMFAAVEAALENGEAICLFPEGISHDRGHLEPLRTGAARMVLNSGARGHRVTILNLGIAARNLNAILRIQCLRDDGNIVDDALATGCGDGSQSGYDYWPNTLYDTREGMYHNNLGAKNPPIFISGVMHYIELDVNNLRRWLEGSIGQSGNAVLDQNGFVVYFSDRRGNNNVGGNETGELGFEDFVNPADNNGTPNGVLDTGEDVNHNGVLDVYGNVPQNPGGAPLDATATLRTTVTANVARTNRAIFFQRALKLTNGALNQVPMPGLTLTSENPVYVEGDFNASAGAHGFVEPNAAAAIMADGITVLSNVWNDQSSFDTPNGATFRNAVTTWYRFAAVSGKGAPFPHPSGTFANFGTDGGHAQLRADDRGLVLRPDGQLPGPDDHLLRQPAGGRSVEVLHQRLPAADARLRIRRRLPRPDSAPAGDPRCSVTSTSWASPTRSSRGCSTHPNECPFARQGSRITARAAPPCR